MAYHVPVLLRESIDGLEIKPNGIYVDLTFGGGGHSTEILKHLSKGKLFAFDQDEEALANAIDDKRFTLIRGNFRFFRNFLRYHGIREVDGILADLGVSSHHFDSPERGFSFRFEGPLDMRMNQKSKKSAKHVVNEYAADDLARVFTLYGELQNAKRLANAICQSRSGKQIETVEQLYELLKPMFPFNQQNKMLAQVFQAIRIEVNQEMFVLEQMLINATKCLKKDGRLVIIAYHSLEDRLVKNYMRSGNFEGDVEKDFYGNVSSPYELVNRKVIVPSDEEIKINSRARSAKLRIGKKI
ncbi:MAG TPA: 16S rRNA (cytosine(1402)-N(4))-methyltransferase [Bacteroidales bacterium]|nr:16S rRNA (cytosine(1402)-N(4))-methyltransferase [Bacteroidales bacterium]